MTTSQWAGPSQGLPTDVPSSRTNDSNGSSLALAQRLLDLGIPVVVCTPCPAYSQAGPCHIKGHEKGTTELHIPSGWAKTSARYLDLSSFRPGVDVLAMVGGHGIDLVDVDTKAGGSVDNLPPFKSYGMTRTPSGGEHYVVPSSGLGKVSPLNTELGHVGDYVGGRPDGTGRLLGFLPGSTRPKYPGLTYVEEVEWDVEACRAAEPDPELVAALQGAGAAPTAPDDYIDESPLRPVEDGVDPVAQEWAERWLGRLDALPEVWSDGDHWNPTHHRVGCVLHRLANSNWTGYTLDQAEADYRAHMRTDEAWGEADAMEVWEAAADTVKGGGIRPPSSAADDFSDGWVDPEAKAKADAARAKAEAEFDRDVEAEARKLRIRQAARELVARAALDDAPAVRPTALSSFLAEPDEAARYRVDGLLPTNGRVVFSAQFKAGKTTLMGNLTRCLADGDRFLDWFDVEQAQRVVLLDNELSPNTIRLWLREQGIVNVDAVEVLSLRGRLSGFNILDPVVRSEWAAAIGPADVMVFDCLRPALDVLGLSEDKEAGRFLVALDELCAEAGVKELVVVHHMGHSSERSRGDSRILDWPDAVWKLVLKDAAEPESPRFFAAHGRDVSHPESQLDYNSENRHLTLVGGSRREAKASNHELDVLNYALEHPGCTQNELEKAVRGDNNGVRIAVKSLIASGQLRWEQDGQKHRHYVVEPGSEFAADA